MVAAGVSRDEGMFYLGWFDDSPKKTVGAKVAEAAARYERRFGRPANVCLVSVDEGQPSTKSSGNGQGAGEVIPGEAVPMPAQVGPVRIKMVRSLTRGHFLVGHEAAGEEEEEASMGDGELSIEGLGECGTPVVTEGGAEAAVY